MTRDKKITRITKPTLSFFKPLVASSLALALSVSVVSAGDCDNATNEARICTGVGIATSALTKVGLPLNVGDGGNESFKFIESGGFHQPQLTNNSALETLAFQFGTGSNVTATKQGSNKVTIVGKTGDTHLFLGTGTKGLKMGSGGMGTLVFDFSTAQTSNKTPKMSLNLGATSGMSLQGNLEVKGKEREKSDTTQDTFDATLQGNIKGNITIGADTQAGKKQNLKSSFDFIGTGEQEITINGAITTKGNGVETELGFTSFTNITITGNITTGNGAKTNITQLPEGATLTLQGNSNQITTLTTTASGDKKATLALQNGNTTIGVIKGNSITHNIEVNFAGGTPTLMLNGATNALKTITFGGASAGTLAIANGGTASISDAVSVGAGKTLNLEVTHGYLSLDKAITGEGTINVVLNGKSEGAEATLIFKNTSDNQHRLTRLEVPKGKYGELKLAVGDFNQATFTDNVTGDNLKVTLGGSTTLILEGTNNKIKTLGFSGSDATLKLGKAGTTSTTSITNGITNGEKLTMEFVGGTAALNLGGTNNNIKTLKTLDKANATINLSSNKNSTKYNSLTIGTGGTGLEGNGYTFQLYASSNEKKLTLETEIDSYADRIVIENANTTENQTLELLVDNADVAKLSQKATTQNIALATIRNTTAGNKETAKVKFNTTSKKSINGEVIEATFESKETAKDGTEQTGGDYTTYFLTSVKSLGADSVIQQIASSALAINYDLFAANFNSINKRLGDLRGNPYTQGVWARIFAGGQESKFGIGSQSTYVTLQSGYDYAFVFEGGKTYAGVALSYAHSNGKGRKLGDKSLDDITSQGFEIAVYNSYFSDIGLYNDSVLKFGYLASDFMINNGATKGHTTNATFLLSNEVGYRYDFGEAKDWFVTPQIEIGLGYLSSSDFKDKFGANPFEITQDSVFLMRSRLGADVGKEFKGEDWGVSLYLGSFCEYDVLAGGENNFTFINNNKKSSIKSYDSNGRFVLNMGSNVKIKESTRVYVDFEKSFGNKFSTQWQMNLGARYSFGEVIAKAQEQEKTQEKAPLKIESGANS
ncbi:hypothetical protein BBW65_05090 [Helicobacter enhydrae]|uniref:Autotransporter domain-containing protein n=1 Tax=Helicobacter enhydrae TaxID=222136 RepID=A0A1B1U683_9HELI|nr:autotransporter outer membrane beta-barrel domain-containing protein [Helicobacter enhydrae]ANV98212.1 hypothetical protein BBW65_05090 [Helicobacter enhydrae]